ncbi:penicillin-insensitive murein endopeptidase, partial [Mesorhizobium sp. M8A.F.Ca.ET.021.01.1.1]
MKTATRSSFGKRSLLAAALGLLALTGLAQPAAAEERAKDLFGAEKLPTATA